jgi:metal transporter CNNM
MDTFSVTTLTVWVGICFCISQSAMFSGLNLAFFSLTRLRLEVEVSTGNQSARRVLRMRQDSNFLLTTILWGNVGINVLLTLLSHSVMAGLSAFLFSTVLITFIGEILPQAYFSRHALKMASILAPVLRFYQILLYPVAKPVAMALDWWLGAEGILFFRERDLMEVIKKHVEADETDIDWLEGMGALNFLTIDDLYVSAEGEPIDPDSIISLPIDKGLPVFPKFESSPYDPFLKKIESSGKKWVIITDDIGNPLVVLDSDGFLREALFDETRFIPYHHCHRPVIVNDLKARLGDVILQLKTSHQFEDSGVIDHDIILVWGLKKRVITGADILGRLLKGVAGLPLD